MLLAFPASATLLLGIAVIWVVQGGWKVKGWATPMALLPAVLGGLAAQNILDPCPLKLLPKCTHAH